MTLTLDEVRRIRFPMARRPNEGYRAGEVDDFVDKVDATFSQMVDESDRLKKQLQALRDAPPAQAAAPAGPSQEELQLREEAQNLRQQSAQLHQDNARLQAELEELRNRPAPVAEPVAVDGDDERGAEIAQLRQAQSELQARNEHLSGQLAQVRTELDQAREEANSARTEADQAKEQVAQMTSTVDQSQAAGGTGRVDRLVVNTGAEASNAVIRLVAMATEQAENLVNGAEADAKKMVRDAEMAANETLSNAQAKAQEIEGEARANAERTTRDADERAGELTRRAQENHDRVNSDAMARRQELFTHLETERDAFAAKIDELKSFESDYRTSLVNHLRGQVEQLEQGQLQPAAAPVLLSDRQSSATPRLDALLAERH